MGIASAAVAENGHIGDNVYIGKYTHVKSRTTVMIANFGWLPGVGTVAVRDR